MAEPARESAAARDPAGTTADEHDPRARGWTDVRHALIADSHLVAQAAAGVAARPGDAAAVAVLTLALDVLRDLSAIGRRWVVDEAVLEAERERAYAAGYEACKASRCRLEVIPGGH